ncbi:MAG TPA: hypothetical protein VF427_11180 [Noviherbaspirillum sp.]
MDLDDSTDKVRRNVIVFSCAIIAITVLKISVNHGSLFGLEIKTASPGRVWLLFFFAAVYLLLRFHFDGATLQARKNAANEFMSGMLKDLSAFLKKKLFALVLAKDDSARRYAEPAPGTFLGGLALNHSLTSLKLDFDIVEQNGESSWSIWPRVTRLRETNARAMNINAEYDNERVEYVSGPILVPTCAHLEFFKVLVRRLLWILYSKGLVDVLVPYLLGLVALGICVVRVSETIFRHL